ncbi:MAG: LytTR family DNA-binding domain-containing protein [Bacteroidota bacterium]
MMMIQCLIIDDEPVAHRILEEYLAESPDMQIAGNCYNTAQARIFLEAHVVDLLFLDIKMPGENGLSFLKTIAVKPVTILTTAMLTHALEAYDLDVIDYLVKPIRPERFRKAIDKAREFLTMRMQAFTLSDTVTTERKFITIKSGRDKLQLDTTTISHIQSLRDYMLIYTTAKKHLIRSTVSNILDILPADDFIRVHKSFIINRWFIKRIGSSQVELSDATIPIGKMFRDSLNAL